MERRAGLRDNPREGATRDLTCGKWLEMVTVLELSIFIQKVLWLKLLWFGEFLAVIQEGVQRRNYDCALEGTEAALVSQVDTTQAHLGASG